MTPELAATRRAMATTTIAAVLLSLFVVPRGDRDHVAADAALGHAVPSWMVDDRTRAHLGGDRDDQCGQPVWTGAIAVGAAAVRWWRGASPRPAILVLTTRGTAGAIGTLSKMIVCALRSARSIQLVGVGVKQRRSGLALACNSPASVVSGVRTVMMAARPIRASRVAALRRVRRRR
jgi:hypothetical protein